jgi:hypothetical protein
MIQGQCLERHSNHSAQKDNPRVAGVDLEDAIDSERAIAGPLGNLVDIQGR